MENNGFVKTDNEGQKNRFLYQGKEWQTELGLNLYDFHARQFDPALGRWLATGPQNQFGSPYLGMANLPTMSIDPDGELAWFVPVIAGAVLGGTTGAIVASNNGQDWWKGAISSAFIGAAGGALVSAAIGATGITTASGALSNAWGITTSAIQGGVVNMAFGEGEGWQNALVGGFSGLFASSGGFGLAKSKGLSGKLAYQGLGTTSRSIGQNWAAGEDPFSKVTLGVGPVNLTLGKGQRLLQAGNNIGNIAANAFGLTNDLFFGGNTKFDLQNLSPVYRGGLIDKIFGGSWGPYAPMLMRDQELPYTTAGAPSPFFDKDLFSHEMHHLWQSRALGDGFLSLYLGSAVFGPLFSVDYGIWNKESFGFFERLGLTLSNGLDKYNYYEAIGYGTRWWK